MNILDENIPEGQESILRKKRIPHKQIGVDVGRKGMHDDELIPLLHQLGRPTFFTLDSDFYDRSLCHKGYCLVYLDVKDEKVADSIRLLLRHPELNTKGKRMGCVIRVMPKRLAVWRTNENQEEFISWQL
jgi:hypothetical protein